jgi:hypothetical protein
MGWTAWLVTTARLEPADVEWMLGHFDYEGRGDEWAIPMDGGGRIDVKLAGIEYAGRMKPEWIRDQEQALSRGLRRAKLTSFVAMNYWDRQELELPHSAEDLAADHKAAWFQVVQLGRFAVEEAHWPAVLCQPNPALARLQIIQPEET